MSNHLHLVAQARDSNLSDILRDFKSYTAKILLNAIQELPESRKEWMTRIFKEEGDRNSNNTSMNFWRQDNQFKEVHNKEFAFQKFNYIHSNPVEAGIVEKSDEYIYSSARDFYYGKNVGLLNIKFWDE